MDEPNLTDLQIATEEQLVDELGRRFTGVLVVMYKYDPHPAGDAEIDSVQYRGPTPLALGLAEMARARIAKSLSPDEVEAP